MYYWRTAADILSTLPPVEQAELITLADAYGIPLEPEPEETGLSWARQRAGPTGPRAETGGAPVCTTSGCGCWKCPAR